MTAMAMMCLAAGPNGGLLPQVHAQATGAAQGPVSVVSSASPDFQKWMVVQDDLLSFIPVCTICSRVSSNHLNHPSH